MELYAAGALIGAPLLVLANNWLKKRGGWRCRRAARVNWSDEGDDVFDRIRAHTCSSKCPPDCDAWAYMVDPDEGSDCGSGGGGGEASELLSRLRRKHRGELDVDDALEDADTVDTMDGDVHVTRSVQRRASLRRRATGRHSRNDSTASDFSDGFEFGGGAKDDRLSDDECESEQEEEEEREERHAEQQEQEQDGDDGQFDAGYEQPDAEEEQDQEEDDSSSQQRGSSQSSAGKSEDASSHRYSLRKHLRRSWTHSDLQGNHEQRIHRKKSPYKV